MHRGLTMSDEEKLRRHTQLYQTVTTQTSHTWATSLAKMLLEQLGGQNLAKQTPFIPKDQLEGSYLRAKKRLFLFDYDVRPFLSFFCCFALVWGLMGSSGIVRVGENDVDENVVFSREPSRRSSKSHRWLSHPSPPSRP